MPPSKLKLAQLRVIEQDGQPEVIFPIYEGQNMVGRGSEEPIIQVDIQLNYMGISGQHACIEVLDGEHFVEDLNSTNGTRIGLSQALIKSSPKMYQLTDKMPVIFGKTVCIYEICNDDLPEELEEAADNIHELNQTEGEVSGEGISEMVSEEIGVSDEVNSKENNELKDPSVEVHKEILDKEKSTESNIYDKTTQPSSLESSDSSEEITKSNLYQKNDTLNEEAELVKNSKEGLKLEPDIYEFVDNDEATESEDVEESNQMCSKPDKSEISHSARKTELKNELSNVKSNNHKRKPVDETPDSKVAKRSKQKANNRKVSVPLSEESELSTCSLRSVMFTGINDEKSTRMVTQLGGKVVDNWQDCTHLVSDKVRRTVKFLCAFASGKEIVSLNWVKASKKAGTFVDSKKYQLKDTASEKKFGFNLSQSINYASENTHCRVFHDKIFYITPSVVPPHAELSEIIEAGGGKVTTSSPQGGDVITIGCDKDREECRRLFNLGCIVCSNEVVLSGVLSQKLDVAKWNMFST